MSKNKQSGIMGALTRKIGPLPAWAWGILAFAGVWYYRNKLSAASSTATSTTTPDSTAAAQQPVVLSPGESVYDPNTGGLSSAPDTSGSAAGGTDIGSAMDDLANAIANGMNVQTSQGIMPGSVPPDQMPAPNQSSGVRMSTLTRAQRKSGAIAAPFGAKKPTGVPAGYKVVGTGKGNWVYKPKSTARNTPSTTRNSSGGSRRSSSGGAAVHSGSRSSGRRRR